MAQASMGKKILIAILVTLLAAVAAAWNLTGLYLVPPIATVPQGETVYYYRRGTGLPFVSSADGLNLEHHNGVTVQTRAAMNALVAGIIGKRVIAKFGYSQSLYLSSTGNRDFSALGKPLSVPAPQQP